MDFGSFSKIFLDLDCQFAKKSRFKIAGMSFCLKINLAMS